MFEIVMLICAAYALVALNRIGDSLDTIAEQLERIGNDIEAME